MLNPEPAVFIPGKYDDNGKWMDGWETRRKRVEGSRPLRRAARLSWLISGVDIDTSHFTGNYPPAASIEACTAEGVRIEHTAWTRSCWRHNLRGNSHHYVRLSEPPASGRICA